MGTPPLALGASTPLAIGGPKQHSGPEGLPAADHGQADHGVLDHDRAERAAAHAGEHLASRRSLPDGYV
jgi:hypothetical protein